MINIRQRFRKEAVEAFFGDEADDITSDDLLCLFIEKDLYDKTFYQSKAWERFQLAVRLLRPSSFHRLLQLESLRSILDIEASFPVLICLVDLVAESSHDIYDPWKVDAAWVRFAHEHIMDARQTLEDLGVGSDQAYEQIYDCIGPIQENIDKSSLLGVLLSPFESELIERRMYFLEMKLQQEKETFLFERDILDAEAEADRKSIYGTTSDGAVDYSEMTPDEWESIARDDEEANNSD